MELMFEEGVVEFSVAGPNTMHLAGSMMDDTGLRNDAKVNSSLTAQHDGGTQFLTNKGTHLP